MRATLSCACVVLLTACAGGSNSLPRRTPATPTPTVNPTVVSGVVLDAASDQPLSGATVEWSVFAGIWLDSGRSVTTEASGRYRMEIPIGGPGASQEPIFMRAMKTGYAEQRQTVTLVLNGETTVNFRLSR
jgi:hypothetical protein